MKADGQAKTVRDENSVPRIDRRGSTVQNRGRAKTLTAVIAIAAALALPVASIAQAVDSKDPGQAGLKLAQPVEPGQSSPHLTITLQDALDRAEKNDAQFSAALTDANIAREDRVQARAAGLPSVAMQTSALLTQGNGKLPSGRFVTNDGIHVYRQWGVVHQDFSLSTLTMLGDRRGAALESLALAKAEIARRGLKVTVTKDYYALVVSARKYATAEASLKQSERFLAITKEQEQQGDVAHSDVIKAQIQFNEQHTALQEAELQMESDRLTLAVLLFPTLTENFSVVDDLDQGQSLPPFGEVQAMASRENPGLRVAMEAIRGYNFDVSAARYAMLPSITADLDYGIEANRFAFRSPVSAAPELGPLPNLGYFATITLNLPVWDWGALRSKVRQAEYRRQQSRVELTMAQRQLVSELYSFYNQAQTAKASVDTLRETASLASEELRLTILRYQAGQATALEVVDAQNTLSQARNAYDDGQARLRMTLAQLQTLTGSF